MAHSLMDNFRPSLTPHLNGNKLPPQHAPVLLRARAVMDNFRSSAYHNMKVNFTEHTTGRIEEVESHLLHKYEIHSMEMLKLKGEGD